MSRYAPGYTGPMTTAGGVKPAKPKTSTQPPGYTGLSSGPPKTKAPPSKTKAPKPMPKPMPKPRVGNMGPGSGGAPMPKPRVMGGSPDKMGGSVKTGMPKMQMGGMVPMPGGMTPKPLPGSAGAPTQPKPKPTGTIVTRFDDSGMGPRPGMPLKPRMKNGGMVKTKKF